MDDRDLEERLRTLLHRRFDGAEPPRELTAGVEQLFTTQPRRLGLADLRLRPRQLGWSVVAAAAVVAVLAVAGLRFGGLLGPGAGDPSPSPTVAAAGERAFIVLPPTASEPSKTQSGLAGDVLNARLRALGVGNFTSGTGFAIQFSLPASGPSSEVVRGVLGATGDVEFVPLPPADYGEGGLTAEVGGPLPRDEPALFGWDGIASVSRDDSGATLALVIKLRPAATAAFSDYSAAHVGEAFAVLIDGRVALLPTINEPIPDGELMLSSGGANEGDRFAQTMAILVGGMLPESWARPVVPVVLPKEQVVAGTIEERSDATLVSADLDSIREGSGWRAVWSLVLEEEFPAACPARVPASQCPTATSIRVILDAETGELISSEIADVNQ